MIEALVLCTSKVRTGVNGCVRVRFVAAEDATQNRRWSDGRPELHHDIILNAENARKFDVSQYYTMTIDLPEQQ